MGQYYKIVNTKFNSVIKPLQFDNGSKLMEHSWVGNSMINAVCNLLSDKGAWYKTNIVWAGDYSDERFTEEYSHIVKAFRNKYLVEKGTPYDYDINLYSISDIAKFTMVSDVDIFYNELQYGFNETKKEYYHLGDCPVNDNWVVHPLPLLVSTGNGQGGGDYFGQAGNEFIGTWANDIIFTANELPKDMSGYRKITPMFIE